MDSSSTSTSPALTTLPSLTSTLETRPASLAPTLEIICGVTYPVDVTVIDACAGETVEISVTATSVLKTRDWSAG